MSSPAPPAHHIKGGGGEANLVGGVLLDFAVGGGDLLLNVHNFLLQRLALNHRLRLFAQRLLGPLLHFKPATVRWVVAVVLMRLTSVRAWGVQRESTVEKRNKERNTLQGWKQPVRYAIEPSYLGFFCRLGRVLQKGVELKRLGRSRRPSFSHSGVFICCSSFLILWLSAD